MTADLHSEPTDHANRNLLDPFRTTLTREEIIAATKRRRPLWQRLSDQSSARQSSRKDA